jgi:23S rRNA pseudouridine955/2504/2580 synthase/23S rRNA pseudouridine1911/1915/1917 synthase
MKYEVIFENNYLIAVNKSSGLLSIPDREGKEISLKQILENRIGKIFTVHRLDKYTSGIILFAKDEVTHKQLSMLFEEREVEKYYLGLVHGKMLPEKGMIDAPIMEHPGKRGKMIVHKKGKSSLTEYEVLENFNLYSWVNFRIHTGRTHQVRVHAQHIGHSIVYDELYGDVKPVYLSAIKRNYHLSKKEEAERPILSRLALHSFQLKFDLNEDHYEFEAPLPKDLKAILQQLRKLSAIHTA